MTGDGPVLPAVGVTAVGVAALRAAETERPERLFADPLAAAFVAFGGIVERPDEPFRCVRCGWRVQLQTKGGGNFRCIACELVHLLLRNVPPLQGQHRG